jgi:hypothetical protein
MAKGRRYARAWSGERADSHGGTETPEQRQERLRERIQIRKAFEITIRRPSDGKVLNRHRTVRLTKSQRRGAKRRYCEACEGMTPHKRDKPRGTTCLVCKTQYW